MHGRAPSPAPPELHLHLVDGPAELQMGSLLTLRGRRWGVTQRMVNEITAFEEGALIVEEQRQGPFRSWNMRSGLNRRRTGAFGL